VANLEGASRLRPFLFGDVLICDNGTVLWRHHRQFISSNTSNMILWKFKTIASSSFLAALYHRIRFRPRTSLGELAALPQTPWLV